MAEDDELSGPLFEAKVAVLKGITEAVGSHRSERARDLAETFAWLMRQDQAHGGQSKTS